MLAAVLVLGCLYAMIVAALTALSTWAERDLHAFPFKDEDWLSVLLPLSPAKTDSPRIMLTGPSTVRQNMLHERFDAAFPDHVVMQAGISLGTLEDVTASLDYMRRIHGPNSLPTLLILGISPRFIANIPRERPFQMGIDRYSPYLAIRRQLDGLGFEPKPTWEGLHARAQFLASKGPGRSRTALVAIAYRWLAGRNAVGGWATGEAGVQRTWMDRALGTPPMLQLMRTVGLSHMLYPSVLDYMAWYVSPYKYTFDQPIEYGPDAEMLKGWWKDVYAWNPTAAPQLTRAHLQKFNQLVVACGIEVWVVNLPEREVSRTQFKDSHYQAYLHLVREAFGEDRLLDLRELLRNEEFYDREHTLPAGSRRLTDVVIGAVKARFPAAKEPGAVRSRACEQHDAAQ